MVAIKQEYMINAHPEQVWEALTDPKIISKWGGGPVKMSDNVGFKFYFWGGDIYGINTKVVKYKVLEQDWYGGDWIKPSKVEFILTDINGKTKLELIHKDLPKNEIEDFDQGWKEYYIGPIKAFLENT